MQSDATTKPTPFVNPNVEEEKENSDKYAIYTTQQD